MSVTYQLFSLARKMAPSIIWIDEIDALFSQRSRSDHSADVYNKALFLSLWDGLANDIYKSDKKSKKSLSNSPRNEDTAQVIILGASNRPQQVDEAFLRRMSRQYEFTMPDEKTRNLILSILLKTEKVHKNVNLSEIGQRTNCYSGSDLKELCKYAATLPLREYVRNKSSLLTRARSAPSKSRNYNENIILDGVSPSKCKQTTTPGWFPSFSKTPQGPPISLNGGDNVNVMEVFENQKEGFVLRPIEQNDLLTALKHIKSTMKAHNDHKLKYGTGNVNSLFNNPAFFGMGGNNRNNSSSINNNNPAQYNHNKNNINNNDSNKSYVNDSDIDSNDEDELEVE